MNKILVVVFSVACLSFAMPAYSDALVQFPAGNAAWTVDIKCSDPRQLATKVEVTKSGEVSRLIITYPQSVMERWNLDKEGLSIIGANNNVYVLPQAAASVLHYAAAISGISSFQWLKGNMLTSDDPVTYDGKECFHYRGSVAIEDVDPAFAPGPAPDGKPASPGIVTCDVWLDKDTHLPVALQHPYALYTFTFLPPPKDSLQLPANFQAELNHYRLAVTPPHRL
jgi:hypothetical protein